MSHLKEILFTCAEDNNNISIAACDPRTGTNLMNYKGGGGAQHNSLCFMEDAYVLTANNLRPTLHVWPLNSQEQLPAARLVTPGKCNALALSPEGCFMVAGIQESLYIWELSRGRLLNTVSKHYQPVTCIKFSADGGHFVSAGQDGGVMVWQMTQVAETRSDDNQTPWHSFNDHGLSVSDVHLGVGGNRSFMSTISLDRTCKTYDLRSGQLLLNVVFAEALKCLVVDVLENFVYVGSTEGNIYKYYTDALPRTKEYHMPKNDPSMFMAHQGAVNCLRLSADNQLLFSAGADGAVHLWHMGSKQLVRSLHYKGAISNLSLRLLQPEVFHPEHKLVRTRVLTNNLKRMIQPPEEDIDDVIEVLVTQTDALEQFRPKQTAAAAAAVYIANTVDDKSCTAELEQLRMQLQNQILINKNLVKATNKIIFDEHKAQEKTLAKTIASNGVTNKDNIVSSNKDETVSIAQATNGVSMETNQNSNLTKSKISKNKNKKQKNLAIKNTIKDNITKVKDTICVVNEPKQNSNLVKSKDSKNKNNNKQKQKIRNC